MGRYKRINAGSDSVQNKAMLQTLVNATAAQSSTCEWRDALCAEAGMPKLSHRPYLYLDLGNEFPCEQWRELLDVISEPRRSKVHKPYYITDTPQGVVAALPSPMLQDARDLAKRFDLDVAQTGVVR